MGKNGTIYNIMQSIGCNLKYTINLRFVLLVRNREDFVT